MAWEEGNMPGKERAAHPEEDPGRCRIRQGRGIHVVWLVPAALIILWLLHRYVWITPEEEVKRFTRGGISAAESLSWLRCDRFLDEEFLYSGGMDKPSFMFLLKTRFNQLEFLEINLERIEVTVNKDATEADADATARVYWRERGQGNIQAGVLGRGDESEDAHLRFVKREGKWKMIWLETRDF